MGRPSKFRQRMNSFKILIACPQQASYLACWFNRNWPYLSRSVHVMICSIVGRLMPHSQTSNVCAPPYLESVSHSFKYIHYFKEVSRSGIPVNKRIHVEIQDRKYLFRLLSLSNSSTNQLPSLLFFYHLWLTFARTLCVKCLYAKNNAFALRFISKVYCIDLIHKYKRTYDQSDQIDK